VIGAGALVADKVATQTGRDFRRIRGDRCECEQVGIDDSRAAVENAMGSRNEAGNREFAGVVADTLG
jgi:hypothetical protein